VVEAHLISEGFLAMEIEKEYDVDNIHIDVHIGDARKVLGRLNKTFNTVFLDPFSPAKSPELYSLQFFQLLKKLVSDDGMILTYTNAAPVRYALIHAGFNVGAGPMVVGKEGTIASNDADILLKPLSSDDERMIALSDAGTPYRDPELNLEPVIISENRQKERISIRGNYKLASTVRTPLYLYNSIKNERMRRRVKKQLIKIGIEDFNSPGSRFIVCPQFNKCICFCGQGRFKNSGDRIKEMERRMEDFVKNPSKYA
jgi:tRNA U34 5-methylaminomethyl-2-thiouridine-forming methyltransferase MnmC